MMGFAKLSRAVPRRRIFIGSPRFPRVALRRWENWEKGARHEPGSLFRALEPDDWMSWLWSTASTLHSPLFPKSEVQPSDHVIMTVDDPDLGTHPDVSLSPYRIEAFQ
jgi:hypothetical protein